MKQFLFKIRMLIRVKHVLIVHYLMLTMRLALYGAGIFLVLSGSILLSAGEDIYEPDSVLATIAFFSAIAGVWIIWYAIIALPLICLYFLYRRLPVWPEIKKETFLLAINILIVLLFIVCIRHN